MNINPTITVITLNANELNVPTKRQDFQIGFKKQKGTDNLKGLKRHTI